MNIRTEYVRYLSEGLAEKDNAAVGIAQKYCALLNTPFTDYDLLDDVYSELVMLYIQTEVSLMKAYAYHMGYSTIDFQTANTIKRDFVNIFLSVRENYVEFPEKEDKINIPTSQQSLIGYQDFQYIDALNRKIPSDEDDFFKAIQHLVDSSPHRTRLRELFYRLVIHFKKFTP